MSSDLFTVGESLGTLFRACGTQHVYDIVPTDLSLWGYLGTLTGSASCYRGMKLPVSGLCLFLFPSLLQVSVSLLSRPFPFPSLRAAVFGGDYAVLTLEYELGKRSSQILELGKAGGRQESKSGWDICVAAAPDA